MAWLYGNLEKNNITYKFENMEYKHFEIIDVDISNFRSPEEILNHISLEDNFYRIIINGEKNIDVNKLKDVLYTTEKSICEIKDCTHLPYDFESISKEKNLKGIFTKKMLEEICEYPDREEEILKAIELVYNIL